MTRYISWNVNGLRAAQKKGFAESIMALDADCICIQETKLQEGQTDLALPGYESYWSYAEKKGYSGTAVFSRKQPLSPKTNIGNAGFSYEERGKFTELLKAGFTDSFRWLYPDRENAYSWWSYRAAARERNVGWRIDYFVVSNRLRDCIQDAYILPDIMGSDHCPVGLDLKI